MPKQILQLEHLEGKWYINMSDFPMWLKGDKTNPTFNYTIFMNAFITKITGLILFILRYVFN